MTESELLDVVKPVFLNQGKPVDEILFSFWFEHFGHEDPDIFKKALYKALRSEKCYGLPDLSLVQKCLEIAKEHQRYTTPSSDYEALPTPGEEHTSYERKKRIMLQAAAVVYKETGFFFSGLFTLDEVKARAEEL